MFLSARDCRDIIDARLYLTDRTDELEREIEENCFCLSGSVRKIQRTTTEEILDFLTQVKKNRRRQLAESGLSVDLIYYLWTDAPAGQLRFNLINANHPRLPFGCTLHPVESEKEIVELFRRGGALDGIPLSELTPVDPAAEDEDDAEPEFILPIYSEALTRPEESPAG